MADVHRIRWLVGAAALASLVGTAHAQTFETAGTSVFGGFASPRMHNPVGFNLARAEYRLPCSITVLQCRTTEVAGEYSRTWSLELGLQDLGHASTAAWPSHRAHALNLSLLGRRPVAGMPRLSVYGKFGTTYGFTDPVGAGAGATPGEAGVGLAYGAGISMDFTPRLSATLGWDSHDFRVSTGLRDVRATSIGLQYRY